MVKSPDGYLDSAKGGRRRIVVLFSDVRDFTARSERENPEALVTQLNEYLSRMVEIIFKHGGTLDKFIGDAIMATWGGLEDSQPAVMAKEALTAAGEMREELTRLNLKWEAEGREGFEAGIGMHIGVAVVGEVGSRARSDFTAIGDAVNLASRIEGITKMMQVPILVSGEIAALQSDRKGICSLGRFRVKGRNEPVEIAAAFVRDEEAFLDGLARLDSGDLVSAEGVLLEVARGSDLAGPAKFYLQQMEVWKRVPLDEWDGVVTLDSK
jgi:adenylate cyclase